MNSLLTEVEQAHGVGTTFCGVPATGRESIQTEVTVNAFRSTQATMLSTGDSTPLRADETVGKKLLTGYSR